MRSFSYTPGAVLETSLSYISRAVFSEEFRLHSSRVCFIEEFHVDSPSWF